MSVSPLHTTGPRFYLPQVARTRSGPRAPLITTAGLAAATDHGRATIVELPDGPVTAAELLERAVVTPTGERAARPTRRATRLLPDSVVTLAKDACLVADAVTFRRRALARVSPRIRPDFVWQRHEAFHDAGLRVARRIGVPFVASVHALKVRESRSWGVQRPGWGWWIERAGEQRVLRAADLVTCVSDEIAAVVAAMLRRDDTVVVVPNGVDPSTFSPGAPDATLRRELDLDGRFVVGWTGSFRSFHGLDQLLEGTRRLQADGRSVALLLVGDGAGRPAVEAHCRRLGVRDVRFAGAVAYHEIPRYLRLMDVCALPATSAGDYHYSPTKLREYMACGRPVVAASCGEIARNFRSGVVLLTVPPGSADAMAAAVGRLEDEPALRDALGSAARRRVETHETWSRRLSTIRSALARRAADATRD